MTGPANPPDFVDRLPELRQQSKEQGVDAGYVKFMAGWSDCGDGADTYGLAVEEYLAANPVLEFLLLKSDAILALVRAAKERCDDPEFYDYSHMREALEALDRG